ncbi:MAG: hypothetical protein M3Y30_16605 [Gemmatimonadota bacterium]|nr:hypothetical protein [Gemmatimonadota bacterium]
MRGTRVLIGTAALLLSGLAAVHAQDQDPSARVARASYLQGEVSFRPGNVDDWTSATLNYPLTTGDHLWTDVNARAELHVGANAIRLAPETAFEILDLDDNHLQIRLTQGSALIRVRTLDSDDNIEIDTPTGAVTLMRDGTYRVDVSSDGATSTVTARNGDAEVTANNETIPVHPDQTVLFTQDGASQDVRNAASFDEYDTWAESRDRAEQESVSAQYVSRDMTGYEDLDRNGTWSDEADYGHVWIPAHVASDWAPYRYGRWAWVEPYGWTWIDDAPWGFAPFHYGRWAYVRERWVWAPGELRRRPVYAPALVVFVGGDNFRGSNWGSRGGVGWFPLAPNEVYRPAYHVSDRYVRRVNVTNVHITNINVTNINVTNIQYRNQRVNGAMTAVPQDQFAGSRRIGRGATIVNANDARNVHVVGDGAPVTPTQQSVLIRRQNTTTPVSRPSDAAQNRQVVWKNTPPPRRTTFASHADQLTTTGDEPVVPPTIAQTRGAPRSGITRGVSPTDGPATVNGPVNTNARPVPNTRPNVNVQRYPAGAAQPDAAPTPAKANPGTPANPNVRVVPNAQPSVTDRPAPNTRPNTNDRPVSHIDGPSPVNGSANGSPAHTVAEPNPNEHPTPNAQPTQAPRTAPASPPNTRPVSHTDVQPNERPAPRSAQPEAQKSPEQGEGPRANTAPREAPRTEAAPPRQADTRQAPERRAPTEEKDKPRQPEHDDKPPHRG